MVRATVVVAFLAMTFAVATEAGCVNGQLPPIVTQGVQVAGQVLQVVLTDLAKGDGAVQIEDDIAVALGAGAVGKDVVAILNEALTILVDMGIVPASDVPRAVAMVAEEQVKMQAKAKRVVSGFVEGKAVYQ